MRGVNPVLLPALPNHHFLRIRIPDPVDCSQVRRAFTDPFSIYCSSRPLHTRFPGAPLDARTMTQCRLDSQQSPHLRIVSAAVPLDEFEISELKGTSKLANTVSYVSSHRRSRSGYEQPYAHHRAVNHTSAKLLMTKKSLRVAAIPLRRIDLRISTRKTS